ncbi:MAG TPA: AAA family ATPase, partial [Candidatus Goldiibacteriota bacterium]|nr:AAA family ATPase [Candidatus Goldiibacteriota bacterium]
MKDLKIEFNEQFNKALDVMENTSKNAFITGKAGTGKSTLLNYFKDTTKKQIVVLAPTGVAAVNIGGQTIHSFFGFKPDVTV